MAACSRNMLSAKLLRLEPRIVYDAAGSEDPDLKAPVDAHRDPAPTPEENPLSAVDSSQTEDSSTNVRVLAISSTLDQADALAMAARDDVVVLQYDGLAETPTSLLDHIREALGDRKAQSLALATHGTDGDGFHLAGDATVRLATLHEPAMMAFWEGVAGLLGEGGRVDVLACDVDAGAEFVRAFEGTIGIDVAASDDATGNPQSGGDWLLESDGVDAGDLYFDARRLAAVDGRLANAAPADIWITDFTPADMQSTLVTLTDASAGTSSGFGTSLCADDERLIIGEPGEAAGGRALIYAWTNGAWVQQGAALVSDFPGSDAEFGQAVGLDGDWAIISDPGDTVQSGRVIFYKWNGAAWAFEAGVANSAGPLLADRFGATLDISGERAVAGIPGANGGAGSVQLVHYNDPLPIWAAKDKLDDPAATPGDAFGSAVGLSGDTLFVGAEGAGSGAGRVYAYGYAGATWNNLDQTIAASDTVAGDAFGASLCFDGARLVVGAPGKGAGTAYVFEWNAGAADWVQMAALSAVEGSSGDRFGSSVSIQGDMIVVGAANADVDGRVDAGASYVFQWSGSAWVAIGKVAASTPEAGAHFGTAVAAWHDQAIVGAPAADLGAIADAGTVSLFHPEPSVPENSPGGTVVGTLSGADPDLNPLTFTLDAGATDSFEIVGAELRVRSGANLDFEAQPAYTVRVAADDGQGGVYREWFTIHVSDVSESVILPPPPPVDPPGGGGEEPPPPIEPGEENGPDLGEPASEGDIQDDIAIDDGLGELGGMDFSFAAVNLRERESETREGARDTENRLTDADLEIAMNLTDLAFSEDILFDESQPQEIREAFGTILQAYTQSSAELAAYLQSAFRSVAESAAIHRASDLAIRTLQTDVEQAQEDPAIRSQVPPIVRELASGQQAVRQATQELRRAILDAATTGAKGFDQAFEDVITAAILSLDEANTRLLVAARTGKAVTRALEQRLRLRTEARAPEAVFREQLRELQEEARDYVSARRRGWDLASQDVFAAFVKRLVSQQQAQPRAPE